MLSVRIPPRVFFGSAFRVGFCVGFCVGVFESVFVAINGWYAPAITYCKPWTVFDSRAIGVQYFWDMYQSAIQRRGSRSI